MGLINTGTKIQIIFDIIPHDNNFIIPTHNNLILARLNNLIYLRVISCIDC